MQTTELPQELNSSPTTPKAGQDEESTSTPSRYSKLSLGFPPLPGFFRSRNSPSILPASAKPARDTAEEGGDAFVDVTTGTSEDAGSGQAGKPEDDDDRGTIKGVIIDTVEQSTTAQLKAEDGRVSSEEKISDPASLTVVSVESFV